MSAQSVRTYVYWEESKSMVADLHRDHARDLQNFEGYVCLYLVAHHGPRIDHAPRSRTLVDPRNPLGRFVYFWVPERLDLDAWAAAFHEAARLNVVLAPRQHWVFTEDAPNPEVWFELVSTGRV